MYANEMTLSELIGLLQSGGSSSEELTRACLDRIAKTSELGNYITVMNEEAIASARRADEIRRKDGNISLLLGIPIAVKDNIYTRGVKTTCGSRMLDGFVPDCDAVAVQKLKQAGAVIIGKANMDELAFGSTNEYSAYGVVKNALDLTRVPGGSSGGSANTVAAGQVPLALGSDTGGSVRQPAAYCGLVGLKPTYSAVSRKGLFEQSPSMEQIGTLSRTCDDALTLLSVIMGGEGTNGTPDLPMVLNGIVRGKRIGIAKEFLHTVNILHGVAREFTCAVKRLEDLGAIITEVSIPSFYAGLNAYHVLSSAEAAVSLERFVKSNDLSFDTVGAEVKRRMTLGVYVTDGKNYDELYIKAAKVRAVIKREYESALEQCDVLISPTAPNVAMQFGAQSDPKAMHRNDEFLAPVSLAGLPAVSVPFGAANGMPVGIQIIGKRFAEAEILNVGKALMK